MKSILTVVLFAVGGVLLGYTIVKTYLVERPLNANAETFESQPSTTTTPLKNPTHITSLKNLVVLNQLFNDGKKLPIGKSGKTMQFSDLVVLDRLFGDQTGSVLNFSRDKTDFGDLLVLNQIIYNGKPFPKSVDSEQFEHLLLWYLILTR